MAKDKRPISEQVSDLTQEQRKRIPRIALFHLMFSLVIAALFIVFAIVPMLSAIEEKGEAWDTYWDLTEEEDQLKALHGEYYMLSDDYMALSDKQMDALDDADAKEEEIQQLMIIGVVCLAIWLGVEIAIIIYVAKKHPYYSDGKCWYIITHRKQLAEHTVSQ